MNFIALVILGIVVYFGSMLLGFHKVNQGHVGLYKKFGVLQPTLTQPGIHFRLPFVENFIEMRVNLQTDTVKDIPCGTSNGILVFFQKIEVVNRLKKQTVFQTVLNYTEDYEKYWITDKIHSEINQFCSKHTLQQIYIDIFDKLDEALKEALERDISIWAPGIEILSVRVTKPAVPERIRANFEQMQKVKVDYFIAKQKQNVKREEQITRQKQAVISEESKLGVKKIQFEKKILLKKNELQMAKIEAQIIEQKFKAETETEFITAFAQAELYPTLYTPAYLDYLAQDAYTSNITLIVGDKIPNIEVKGISR